MHSQPCQQGLNGREVEVSHGAEAINPAQVAHAVWSQSIERAMGPGYASRMPRSMCLSLTAAALLSSAAFATEASLPADAPVHLALASPGARLLSPQESLSSGADAWSIPGYVPHFGVAFATAFVAIPAGQYLATLFGNLSNNLIGGLIPGALVMGLVAPALVALASWLYGNKDYLSVTDKPFRFLGPWLITTGVHIVSLIIAGFAGVTVAAPATIFTLALIEGLVLAGANVGSMRLLQNKPSKAAVTIRSFAPGVSDTTLVPLAQTEF